MPKEELRIGQISIRFLIDGPASAASVTIFEFDIPPGTKAPAAHSHPAYDETIYGLEGILTTTLNGQPAEIGPGDVLFIPRGSVHRVENLHAATSRSLAVLTPGILGSEYYLELASIIKSSADSKTPPDPAAIAQIMLRYGIIPAPQ
jgi:quercetin dioxygenase-like cupin family protein